MTPLLTALAGDGEIEALLGDAAQLDAMLAVERALAQASAETGLISADAAAAIETAIGNFVPDWTDLAAGLVRDGVVVPALLAQLRPTLPEAHRSALHRGATSQDIIDTALMLQVARVLDIVEARLDDLLHSLDALAATHATRPLMAHTRMQAALPITWGLKLDSWCAPLRQHRAAVAAMRPALLVIQLGGPVGDRQVFGPDADRLTAAMARRLELGMAPPWHTAREPIVALGDRLALVTGSLGKFGADVALLAQSEVAAISLTGGGTSSAMAHKSNPVAAELLVALARFNAGLAGTLHQAMVHEYERSGAAWTLEWLTLPRMFTTAGAALRHARALAGQIRPN